jgi:NADH-quinone oxidoreductase E subunit
MAPAFSTEGEARLKKLLGRYPDKRAALIPVLHLASREFGFLSREAMEYVAGRLGLPESYVLNTATFYTMLPKRPLGRFHVQVCVNVACHLRGADGIVEHLKRRLGIGPGEMTEDRMFSLEGVQCLAACGTAPAMQVNDDYYEDLTLAKVDEILDALRSSAGGAA